MAAGPKKRKDREKPMMIRKADEKDIDKILDLLSQVLEVHAIIRPDLFVSGTRKYNEKDLREILGNELRPIFVAEIDGEVVGDVFCVIEETTHSNNYRDTRTLYIDDICVDEKFRRKHVGRELMDFVMKWARDMGCYTVTLNVWEGNDRAMAFYRSLGFEPRKTIMEKIV